MFDFIGSQEMGYYIFYHRCLQDKDIANLLKINLRTYHIILKKYNAYVCKENNEYFFQNIEDVEKCRDYLNNKYEIILKLMGE